MAKRAFVSGDEAAPSSSSLSPLSVLMVGTGEYTTGYTDGGASKSDKGSGVVALTLADLRARTGKVGDLKLAGVRGSKFPSTTPRVCGGPC